MLRIRTIVVTYEVKTEEEEKALLGAITGQGCVDDRPKDKGVEEVGEVAYTPSSDRTRRAYESLSRCSRVSVLRPEVLEKWAVAYPHVDLGQEIAKCEAWAESKGVTRTPRGWQKSLNTWFSKAQDNTRGNNNGGPTPQFTPKPPVVVQPDSDTKAWIEANQ